MLLPATAAGLISAAMTLFVLLALQIAAPSELDPLSATDAAMRNYAAAGYFPLQAAAESDGRHLLSTGAAFQTFAGMFVMFMAAAYGAWRGVTSPRARGWTNAFWIASIAGICLFASTFHGLTPQKLDYLIGADDFGARLSPVVLLLKRGLYAAGFAAFLSLFAHDMGYRLREALVDFGLIAEDEERSRREAKKPFKNKGWSRRITEDMEPPRAEEGGFGHRGAPPQPGAATSEEARARAVLGVGADAGKREIERAFRSQMKRAHPDHGGSVARAAALNAARDLLLGR